MRRSWQWLLLLAALLGICGCRNQLINAFAFYPERLSPAASAPADAQELMITSSDGEQLQALWFDSQSDQTVLYLHGNAGHLYYRIDDARQIAASGVNVLLLSYRGYGKSSGSPSEQGVYLDAQAALNYLLQQRGFGAQDVFVYGRSIGSAVAIDVAQRRPLAGLILITPFPSGNDMARTIGLGWLNWTLGSPFDSLSKLPDVSAPALFIHGEQDQIVPITLGRKLFDAYPGAEGSDKRFIAVAGAKHNDLSRVAAPDYWYWISAFIAKTRGD